MARRKAEIDLLGVASKEELIKFEIGKEADQELSRVVSEINAKNNDKKLTAEEEMLLIKKRGEQEILDVQNELKEFKVNEERKISFLPIDDDDEEEEEYEPTRSEKIKAKLKAPFIKFFTSISDMSWSERFDLFKTTFIVILVMVTMVLSVQAVQKRKASSDTFIKLELEEIGAGQVATPGVDLVLNEDTYKLARVIIDGQNTVLEFENFIDFGKEYSAYIIDNYEKTYEMDQHYMRNVRQIKKNKVLAMYPLNDGIKEFTLVITNNETDEKYTYNFRLKDFLKKSDFVKLYNDKNVTKTGVNVNAFIASASSSRINYSLNHKGLDYQYKIIDRPGMHTSLFKNLRILPSKQSKITQYDFPSQDLTLIEEVYISPEDFQTTLKFEADNIFKSYNVNKDISVDTARAGTKIDFGHYTLFIEGLQKQGDTVVLVYSTIDNEFVPEVVEEVNPKTPQKTPLPTEVAKGGFDEFGNDLNFKMEVEKTSKTENVYTILDAEIVTFDHKGNEVEAISTENIYAGDEGTDMVFIDDRLNSVVGNFKIRINSIDIRDEKYITYIDLGSYGAQNTDKKVEESITNIVEAFNSRQAYKATKEPRSNIVNFSGQILSNKDIMDKYQPEILLTPAIYSSNVILTAFNGSNVYAIVEEDFAGHLESGFIHKNYDHRIIYNTTTKKIIFDEIIKENKVD